MTVQVNVRISDEDAAGLDRWASDLGIERATLLRDDIIAEALTARRDGRARYERPAVSDPADLPRALTKVGELTTELERVLRQSAKRDAESARQKRTDTQGVSEARDAIVADVVAQMRVALEVVHGELVRTREELTALMGRLPQLAAVNKKLDQVLEFAKQPRVANTFNLGWRNWSARKLALVVFMTVVSSAGFYIALALVLPQRVLAVRTANLLLGGGDQAICALVDYRHSTDTCRTRVNGRDVGVSINVPAPKRERRR